MPLIRIQSGVCLVVGVCFVVLAGAASAPSAIAGESASGRPRSTPPLLGGRTTITGNETAVTEVRLDAPARVRIQTPDESGKAIPGMRITGEGGLAGFYLTEPDLTDPGRTDLLAVQTRFCARRTCQRGARSHHFVISSENSATTGGKHRHPKSVTVPAGRYLLYLLTDGSPVSVRLRLRGLAGVTSINPSSTTGSRFVLPTTQNSTTAPGEKAFWYGHEADFQGAAGFYFGALRMQVEDYSHLRWGLCVGQGPAPAPPSVAYSPLCPGGTTVGVSYTQLIPVDDGFVYPFFAFVKPGGKWRFGQYFTGVFTEAEFDSVGFHMNLDPAAAR